MIRLESLGATVIPLQLDGTTGLIQDTIDCLQQACDQAEDLNARSVLAIAYAGPRGGTTGTGPGPSLPLVNRWERAVQRVERCAAVTVMHVDGHAGELGLGLLLATDYRTASPDASFSLHDAVGRCMPGMALYRLAQQVGIARARGLVLLGQIVPALQAERLGLLDALADDAAQALDAFARAATHLEWSGVLTRRQLLLESTATSFEEALGAHLAAYDRKLRDHAFAAER